MKNIKWFDLIAAAVIVVFLAFNGYGCAQMFTAKTKARYEIRPDGTKIVEYESDKEQVGLDAKFGDVRVKVDKASTQEEVIAAVLGMQSQILGMIKELAAAGKLAGS
jgi:hypothetical protein